MIIDSSDDRHGSHQHPLSTITIMEQTNTGYKNLDSKQIINQSNTTPYTFALSLMDHAKLREYSEGDKTVDDIPFAIHWNNRLCSAMIVLITIVGSGLTLDVWFLTESVAIALFEPLTSARFEVLEAFLHLIEQIFIRFYMNTKMRQSKMTDFKCANKKLLDGRQIDNDYDDFGVVFIGQTAESRNSSSDLYNNKSAPKRINCKPSGRRTPNTENTNALLEIIFRCTNTLVTRATAMKLCALLMISVSDPEPFVLQCLRVVLDDARINPFERGEQNKIRSNRDCPLENRYTVAEFVPSLSQAHIAAPKMFSIQSKRLESSSNAYYMAVVVHLNLYKHKKIIDELQVERFESNFDFKTARNIRHFFSRAAYNRETISINTSSCINSNVLFELLSTKTPLPKTIVYSFDSFMLFHDFIGVRQADHTLLLDFLVSFHYVDIHYDYKN